jgi:hypothetical protein
MALTPHRRLDKLEQTVHAWELADLQHACARAGASHGYSGQYVLQELRRYLEHPDDRMEALEATLTPAEQQDIAQMKARYRRILGVRSDVD